MEWGGQPETPTGRKTLPPVDGQVRCPLPPPSHTATPQTPLLALILGSCFGTPLLGYLTGARLSLLSQAAAAQRTSLLSLHGRADTTVPAQARPHATPT